MLLDIRSCLEYYCGVAGVAQNCGSVWGNLFGRLMLLWGYAGESYSAKTLSLKSHGMQRNCMPGRDCTCGVPWHFSFAFLWCAAALVFRHICFPNVRASEKKEVPCPGIFPCMCVYIYIACMRKCVYTNVAYTCVDIYIAVQVHKYKYTTCKEQFKFKVTRSVLR